MAGMILEVKTLAVKNRLNYFTHSSLNLRKCLHLPINSDLLLSGLSLFFKISNFSVRQRSHFRLPPLYGLQCFKISHLIEKSIFLSLQSHTWVANAVFLHSVIFIDWMYCGRLGPENRGCLSVCLSVCLCVCVSVCLSVESRLAKLLGRFQPNFPT